MLAEQRKNFSIPLRQFLLHLLRQAVRPRIQFLLQLKVLRRISPPIVARIGQGRQVQFRNHHLQPQRRIRLNTFFGLVQRRIIQPPVPLHPDTVNAKPFFVKFIHQTDHRLTVLRLPHIIVIVVQFGTGVGLVGKLKCPRDIVRPDDLQPFALPQISVAADGLVDYIPRMNPPLVAADDGINMFFHAPQQQLAIRRTAVRFFKHPRRRLTMPHQRMAHQKHLVLFAELHKTISGLKGIYLRLGMNAFPFQNVFRRNRIKVLENQSRLSRGLLINLVRI